MGIKFVNGVLLLAVAWVVSMATVAGAGPGDATFADGMAEFDGELLEEMERQIHSAKKWFSEQELSRFDGERSKRERRDPHDLLHHFGCPHSQSQQLAEAARVLQNVSDIHQGKFSQLPPNARRQLCAAAGYDITVEDCPASTKYPTPNGACNNLLNVNWGKTFTPLVRMLPAAYADDLANPRLAKSGNPLPGARDVSRVVVEANGDEPGAAPWTVIAMHFGQFLDHDIDHSALEKANCSCETSPQCLPIPISADDPFFQQPCLRFARSVLIPDADCNTVPRQQVNQITSFLDLSQVYGSTLEKAMEMRDVIKGTGQLLAMDDPHNDAGKEFLPNDEEHKDCIFANPELKCGLAGDVRAAEQPGLTSIHTVLLRQHNRIAAKLAELNPNWNDDERYYNEARRICNAMWQHVVYNEYLPPLMGSQNMAKHALRVHPNAFMYGYDPYLNPGVTNVFASAAYRFGHSQVPSTLWKLNRDHEMMEDVPLNECFFNATHMNTSVGKEGLDAFVRGMIAQPLAKVDLVMSHHLKKHMFADPPGGEGLDLAALNIQRARDHGIAPYNDWRVECSLPRAASFEDLGDHMSTATIQKFREAYENVEDIDLFPALLGEEPVAGQLVGPTLACLLGRQFHALKFGDRFWYENGQGDQAFTRAQLAEIRKATTARLFCDNLNDLPTVQPYVFKEPDITPAEASFTSSFYNYSRENDFPNSDGEMPGFFNKRVPCTDTETIPLPSLAPWQDGYIDASEEIISQELPFSLREADVTWYGAPDEEGDNTRRSPEEATHHYGRG